MTYLEFNGLLLNNDFASIAFLTNEYWKTSWFLVQMIKSIKNYLKLNKDLILTIF